MDLLQQMWTDIVNVVLGFIVLWIIIVFIKKRMNKQSQGIVVSVGLLISAFFVGMFFLKLTKVASINSVPRTKIENSSFDKYESANTDRALKQAQMPKDTTKTRK